MRNKIQSLIKTEKFNYFIVGIIILNSIILGLQTSPYVMDKIGPTLNLLDDIILGIFIVELSLYLYANGFKKCFTDPWYLFDLSIVISSLLAVQAISSLRALRVLRVLRLITKFPNLKKIIAAMFKSLPGIGSILTLLLIFMYVGALLATNLFGADYPDDFGSLRDSTLTLFQLMVTDDAGNVIRTVMATHPYSWTFLVGFILITAFIILNLFVAAIVDGMQNTNERESDELEMKQDLKAIKKDLRALNRRLDGK